LFAPGGDEHRIQRGEVRYIKATHAGQCGFTVIPTPGGPTLTKALPAEYLHRLLVANRTFGDDLELIGVTREAAGIVIVTSQPTIVGEGASRDDMLAFFAARHFTHVPHYSAGYPGALSFYRDLDQIAVFDAHPANFLKDGNRVILPIDGLIVECDDALSEQILSLIPRDH
jgi:hypothetical protein